jgi:hypothetical protein
VGSSRDVGAGNEVLDDIVGDGELNGSFDSDGRVVGNRTGIEEGGIVSKRTGIKEVGVDVTFGAIVGGGIFGTGSVGA